MTPAIANIAFDLFLDGGPLMWPLLVCLIAALTVMAERAYWWHTLGCRNDRTCAQKALERIAAGDSGEALELCEKEMGPCASTLQDGLRCAEAPIAAMLAKASEVIEEAEKRLWVLGSFITMAPLLGLLGTVSGIMRSFNFVGDEALAVTKVSGGIAEALIATACGLAIAILCLVPYNYFNRRLGALRSGLERTINQAEVTFATCTRNDACRAKPCAKRTDGSQAQEPKDNSSMPRSEALQTAEF